MGRVDSEPENWELAAGVNRAVPDSAQITDSEATTTTPAWQTVTLPHSNNLQSSMNPGAPLRVHAPPFCPLDSVGDTANVPLGMQSEGGGEAVVPVPTLAAAPLEALSVALLAQQLPSLPNFTGEHLDGDRENFVEWLERFELVASTCRWDDQTKLVNVATRLRGSASCFYCSCTPQQRASYGELTC